MPHSIQVNAIHEASHAVIAQLFSDSLSIQSISLTPKSTFKHVPGSKDWAGAIHIKFKKYKKPKPIEVDALIIANWAGFVGQNIAYLGVSTMTVKQYDFLINPNNYNTVGIEDDYKVVQRHSPAQAHFRGLTAIDYQRLCLKILLDFFIGYNAWKYVIALSDALLAAKDQNLNKKEILEVFRKSKYTRFLRKNRIRFLNQNFVLTWKQRLYYYFTSL